jgi:REP element-mobilizing transposase RayT
LQSAAAWPKANAMASSVWRINFNPEHLYFVTTRAVQSAKIFRRDDMKRIVVESLAFMRSNGWMRLYAFVVMPNHIHFIAQCHPAHPVQDIVRDFKKYTSKQIVAQYVLEGNTRALEFLRTSVKRPGKQTYAVWASEYQAKDVVSPGFLAQKLNYIHHNPLQPHWQLADRPEAYAWSSARYYLCNEPAILELDDARDLLA